MEQYWFVFDIRGNFQTYEASFAREDDAREWGAKYYADNAYVTRDFQRAIVKPKSLVRRR